MSTTEVNSTIQKGKPYGRNTIKGTTAEMLALVGMVEGQEFFSTDTKCYYTYNGANWICNSTTLSDNLKNGEVLKAVFAGNPKRASVAFVTPMATANYSFSIGVESMGVTNTFTPTIENVTVNGFDINMNANNIDNLTKVSWLLMDVGDN